MSDDIDIDAEALAVVRAMGEKRLEAAEILRLICLGKDSHRLARIYRTERGPLYRASLHGFRLHSSGLKGYGGQRREVWRLLTPERVAASRAVPFVDFLEEEKLPAACACGRYAVSWAYLLGLVERPPRSGRAIPRVRLDPAQLDSQPVHAVRS